MTFKSIALSLVSIIGIATMPLLAQDTSAPSYVIQPNDLLTVFVYNHPELSLDVTVQPDGRISIPLAQNIQAAGLSTNQLKAATEKRLSDVIDVPNVTIILKTIQSYRVFVTGKVQKQGILAYEKPITVVQALTLAGGFQDYAKRDEIVITRTTPAVGATPQKELRFTFSYNEFLLGKNPATNKNIYLESGDVVIVP